MESSDERPIIDYAVEPHCVLCRNKIQCFYSRGSHQYDDEDASENFENWEPGVMALGFTDPETSGIEHTIPRVFCCETELVDINTVYVGIANIDINVRFRPWGTQDTAGPIFFVHKACRELARMSEPKPSYADLYNLGLQLRETMPRDCFKAPNPWNLASFASGRFIANSKWKSLLMKCAQLPVELQGRIMSYANADKTTFALLTVLTTSSLGLVSSSAVSPHSDGIPDLMSSPNTKTVYLCGSFNNIFGVNYLCHVEVLNAPIHCDALNPRPARIEVDMDRIRNIEFILGPVGILALRFHSADGSKSSWLGSAARGWRCGPIPITLEDIDLLRNGHKNVLNQLVHVYHRQHRIRVKNSEEIPRRVLWDVTRDLPDSGELFLGELYNERGPHFRALNYFRPQLMCSYLPLRENGVPVRGITVYACDEGTTSVIVHTRSSDIEVSATGRRGTPTSFYFRDGEEIVTMGLATVGPFWEQSGPYLTFKTNQQRLVFFGPPLMLRLPPLTYLSLIPARLKQGCAVAGLIVNTLWKSEKKLTTFGAHCEPRQYPCITGEMASPPEWQITYPAMPDIVYNSWLLSKIKTTTAELTNIKQLRVQYRPVLPGMARRCAGLLIHHIDGSIEVAGCWDGSLTTPSGLIYDSETDGELLRLAFHMKIRPPLRPVNEAFYYMSEIVAHATCPRVKRYPDCIIDDEDFEPEELEDEDDNEPEELEDENDNEEEEIEYPYEKTFDWDIQSSKRFITWCFTKKFDHIVGRDIYKTDSARLKEDGMLHKIW